MHLKIEIRGASINDLILGLQEAVRKTKIEVVMHTGDNTGEQEFIKPFETIVPSIDYDFVINMGNKKRRSF